MRQLPLVTHTALDAVQMLTGVNTAASNSRGSTINGLPGNTINITLDGINVQDNRSHEGFFMYIRPMLDSIEEISVSTSTPGAEASGQGATQIRMTTRSGANRFSGSLYNTWRNQAGTERRRRHLAQQQERLPLETEQPVLVQQARPAQDGGR